MYDTGSAERALAAGFDPYATGDTGDTGFSLKRLSRKAKRAVRSVPTKKIARSVSRYAKPYVKAALPAVQNALRNAGPMGMVASGALGAMSGVLQGQSLEKIAWAAAEGAAPSGINLAIRAARDLREGKSPVSVALGAARSAFVPGSAGEQGFGQAVAALKAQASKDALGAARRRLPSEAARRAFDAAVGTVAQAAKAQTRGVEVGFVRDRFRAPDPMLRRTNRPNISPLSVGHGSSALVTRTIRRNPALAALDARTLATRLGVPLLTAQQGLEQTRRALPYRRLRTDAGALVRRCCPTYRDTAGLVDGGAVYVVESGDSLWKISQKLIGDGNRYRELMNFNSPPYKKNAAGDNFVNLWAGQRLSLPPSWIAQTQPAQTAESILQAKALLVTWSKTDGAEESGLTDYGLRPSDLTVDWTDRDRLTMQSFARWSNGARGTRLDVDGTLTADKLEALRAWAEARPAEPVESEQAPVPSVPWLGIPFPIPGLPLPAPAPEVVTPGPLPGVPHVEPAPMPDPWPGLPFPLPSIPAITLPESLPPVTPPVFTPPEFTAPSVAPPEPEPSGGAGLLVLAAAAAALII